MNEAFAGEPLSFFFLLEKRLFNEQWNQLKKPGIMPEFLAEGQKEWQYYNGLKWEKIENIDDQTTNLNDQGIVGFICPKDFSQTSVFGKSGYWIRLTTTSGSKVLAPRLKGIFPNTVNVINHIEVQNEVLGTSNGKPDQSFTFAGIPVLAGQIIEVCEPEFPSTEEINELKNEDNQCVVTESRDESGNVIAVYVRWHQVGDFTLSGPKSRHYTINRMTGVITFGNGKSGMIPPKGSHNIIARNYKTGGGKNGNVPAESISSLKKTVANIESVKNYCESFGGSDQEVLQDLMERAPFAVKTKNRAVTAEDYEWLAREADPMVYRSRCIRRDDGKVQIIILPRSEESSPYPAAQMIRNIQDYLMDRSVFTLAGDIEASGPQYKVVDVKVVFKPVRISESMAVQEKLTNEIKLFFHSIKGNIHNEGWDFGEDVYSSDLSARLEALSGVDYIKRITLSCILTGGNGTESITGIGKIAAAENEIISCGSIDVSAEA